MEGEQSLRHGWVEVLNSTDLTNTAQDDMISNNFGMKSTDYGLITRAVQVHELTIGAFPELKRQPSSCSEAA